MAVPRKRGPAKTPPHPERPDCRCARCNMRRAWARGAFVHRPRRATRPDFWTPEQDAALRELAGTRELAAVAQELARRFPACPRTTVACRVRCTRLGISAWGQGYSLQQLERLFGVDHRAIVHWWVTPGLLPGRRWSGRGPNDGWWFEPEAVERFVRECGYAYDWRRMRQGRAAGPDAPLAQLAALTAQRDPWCTRQDLARYVGITVHNLDKWRRRGLVPHERRVGAGGLGEIMVRARDFPAIRDAIHAAQARARGHASGTGAPLARSRGAEALTGTCRNGHVRTAENTYIDPRGKRTCRTCRNQGIWYEPPLLGWEHERVG